MPVENQRLAQIDMSGGNLAIDGDSLPDQRDAFVGPSPLQLHHAEHVRGVEMRRAPRQNVVIDALGPIEVVCPMQRHSFPETRLQLADVPFHRTSYFVSS